MKNQKSIDGYDSQPEGQKRKWPYEDHSYQNFEIEKNDQSKKCMITYDYENHYQHAVPTSNTSTHHMNSMNTETVICNQQQHQHQHHHQTEQILSSMEISENIEYVNILYDDELLTSIQAPVATETNYINFEPNWGNADILDLDQRNYYYETTNANAVNLNDLNGQMSQITQQESSNNSQQHHQQQYHVLHPTNSHQSQLQIQTSTSNSQMQNVTEYQVIQNVYVNGNENDPENGRSNLPTVTDDSEDKNLSWLYNYKLNELPHLSPEVNRSRTETGLQVDKLIQEVTSGEVECPNQPLHSDSNIVENPAQLPKKPPFTYTELIEYALEDKGELTVSGIYNWISDRFPFYKSNDDRWKNSVRHNLSINPHFRKGNKAPQGAGHLWIISTRDSEANILAWEHKKQRLELFFKMEKTFGQNVEANNDVSPSHSQSQPQDETSVAVANLTSILERPESPKSISGPINNVKQKRTEDELKRSAGEILNGVKRTVEVQVVNPDDTFDFQNQTILDFPDYLNPVPKDQIVHECGLRSTRNNNNEFCNDFFIAGDMEPIELGINMNTNSANDDDDGLFGDEFNLNYFITPGSNIMT